MTRRGPGQPPKGRKTVGLQLDPELHEGLKERAQAETEVSTRTISVSDIANRVLGRYLARVRKKA